MLDEAVTQDWIMAVKMIQSSALNVSLYYDRWFIQAFMIEGGGGILEN